MQKYTEKQIRATCDLIDLDINRIDSHDSNFFVYLEYTSIGVKEIMKLEKHLGINTIFSNKEGIYFLIN